MLVSGAGALYLLEIFGFSWFEVYFVMAILVIVGLITILFSKEPEIKRKNKTSKIWSSYNRFLKILDKRNYYLSICRFYKKPFMAGHTSFYNAL